MITLLDREGEPIDLGGCNCDIDHQCNNPACVMESEATAHAMYARYRGEVAAGLVGPKEADL